MSAALASEDRLPHDRAVWRDYRAELLPFEGAPAPGTGGHQVCIDKGDGEVIIGWGHLLEWGGTKRWRFGWPPA